MAGIDRILLENIRITAQVITEVCQRNTRNQVSEQPLSRNQYYILKILPVSGEFLMNELARFLDISPAAASKNIDRMEQMGLVRRRPRTGDRRSLEVVLLDPGRAIVDEFDRITMKKQASMLSQFSPAEKEELLGYLQRIVRYTLAEESNTDLICLQCGGRCGDECIVASGLGVCAKPKKR